MNEEKSKEAKIDWDMLLDKRWIEQKDEVEEKATETDDMLGLFEAVCTDSAQLLSEKEEIRKILKKYDNISKKDISDIFLHSDELNRKLTRIKMIVKYMK